MSFLRKLLQRPPEYALQLGRNDPCWCGSGKNYKRCHHDSDQKYFARTQSSACSHRT